MSILGLVYGNVDAEQGAKEACKVFVPHEFTMWDLRPLEQQEDSEDIHDPDYTFEAVEFNFCRYLDRTSYFARKFIPS